jgi:hypothetical protein
VSNLDHLLVSGGIASRAVSATVLNDFEVSDHLPLSFSIVAPFNRAQGTQESKWRTVVEWNKVDILDYEYCIDNLLAKIETPIELLQNSVPSSIDETYLKLN